MSEDWQVRTPDLIDAGSVSETLRQAVPGAVVRFDDRQQWLVVVDRADTARVWVSAARPVLGAGERVYLTTVCVRGTEAVPPFPSPHACAEAVAHALAGRNGGSAHRLSTALAPAPDGAPVPPDSRPQTYRPTPLDSPPDAVHDRVGIVVQTAPRMTVSPWLVRNRQWADTTGAALAVVTPAGAVASPPAFSLVRATGTHWVVDTGSGLYDGLTGAVLEWDGGAFVPTGATDPAFAPSADDGWSLHVDAETMHPYEDRSQVGVFAQAVYAGAGLSLPLGAGLLEPPEGRFDAGVLTRFAQEASPSPCRFVLSAPDSDGVLEVLPQPPGIVERVELVADTGAAPRDPAALEGFAARVLEAGAQVATLGYRRTADGRGVPARLAGPTIPAAGVFARTRFPALTDREALRLGGATARLVERPVPALVVLFDVTAERAGSRLDSDGAEHPVLRMQQLMDGLAQHDSHRQAARSSQN